MELTNKKITVSPALKLFSLEGKTAIITGAGSGLGAEITQGFAMSGADVVLVDRYMEPIQKLAGQLSDAGYRALPVQTDVTNSEQVNSCIQTTLKEFGSVDILINCAGIRTRPMPIDQFDEDEWDKIIDVNLKGVFLFTKFAAQAMLKKGKGSIVNFGSMGSIVAIPTSSAYCSSKGGVAMLTKTAACEWAKKGIRVNALLPGVFETPIMKQGVEMGKADPKFLENWLARFPMGRFGQPEEIVGACIFLASDASSYITGSLLSIDGGCTAY
jgi:NAD(P)-dependent dehydrogenase (short-subunit alcohol dehydrogenase family)